jgi:exodeoxyribonuclease-5
MLSADQIQAVDKLQEFLKGDGQEILLTGRPGTGKTFITEYVTHNIKHLTITATTNKALGVLRDSFKNKATFCTIHQLLDLKVVTNYATGSTKLKQSNNSKFVYGVVVIDEASMIDAELKGYIQNSILDHGGKVIYIGDKYQLPPVKGNPVIFGKIPEVELTTIHRQQGDHGIKTEADRFRDMIITGKYDWNIRSNNNITVINKGSVALDVLEDFYNSLDYLENPNYIRTLAYTNKTVNDFNNHIRENSKFFNSMLGKGIDEFPSINESVVVNKAYMPDKSLSLNQLSTEDIITIKHKKEKEVSMYLMDNNITLKVEEIVTTNHETVLRCLDEEYKDMLIKALKKEDHTNNRKTYQDLKLLQEAFIDIRPIHAQTIHKSQGSTYENVFIDYGDIMKCKDLNTRARLMYVALTRAKNHAYVYVGE